MSLLALDREGRILYANAAAAQLLGRDSSQLKEAPLAQFIAERDRAACIGFLETLWSTGAPAACRLALAGPWHPPRAVRIDATCEAPGGECLLALVDVSERQQLLDTLVASESSYRALVNSIGEALYVQDRDGRFVEVNDAVVRMYGYPREALIGQSPAMLSAPGRNDMDAVQRMVERAFAGEPQRFEFWGRRANGEIFPKDVRLAPGAYFGQQVIIALADDITERKRTEEALLASERQFRLLFEANPLPMWVYDTETLRILAINDAAVVRYGYSRDEFLRMAITDIRPVEDVPRLLKSLAAQQAGLRDSGPWKHRTKDGQIVLVEITSHPIVFEGREGQLILASDITARVEAEAAQLDSEERLRLAVEAAHLGTFDWDIPGGHLTWSRRHEVLWGFAPGEFGGTFAEFAARVHPDDLPGLNVEVELCIANRGPFACDFRVRWPDGSVHWVQAAGEFIFDGDGQALRMHGVVADITERMQAVDQLLESEDRYRDLVEHSHDLICTHDLDGRILSANAASATMLGYSVPELVTMNLRDIFDPSAPPDALQEYFAVLRRDGGATGVMAIRTRSGDRRVWAYQNTVRAQGHRGPIVRGMAHDITDRKRAERNLRRLSLAVEQSPAATIITDIDGRIEYVNPKCVDVTGYSAAELIGQTPSMLKSGLTPPATYEDLWRTVLAGRVWRGDLQNRRKSGELYWEATTISPLTNAHGEIVNIIAVKQDLTERFAAEAARTTLEAQLRVSQKMQALGTLASGFAHDFNNILGAIAGFTELALAEAKGNASLADSLAEVARASARATSLVRQILTVGRQSEARQRVIYLAPVIHEALHLLRAAVPTSVSFVTTIAPDTAPVMADPAQVHQILMNLGTNAAHAMRGRTGQLDVTLANCTLGADQPDLPHGLQPGQYVRLSVADTGCGMRAETLERAFDPFFTTKAMGEGTGLGLSIVHGIVRSHGGAVTVRSTPDEGTTFDLYFPAVANAVPDAASDPVPTPRGHGELVLVVDDEMALGKLLQRVLERLGYAVDTHHRPMAALDAVRAEPRRYAAVITDLHMPQLSGLELARELRGLALHLPILLTSGNPGDVPADALRELDLLAVVPKPYSSDAIGWALHRALTDRTGH